MAIVALMIGLYAWGSFVSRADSFGIDALRPFGPLAVGRRAWPSPSSAGQRSLLGGVLIDRSPSVAAWPPRFRFPSSFCSAPTS